MLTPPIIRARQHPAALEIIGQPVAQSLSPVMQGAALVAAGLPVRYGRRDVAPDDVRAVLDELRRTRVGGNVTMPHKAAVFAECSVRSSLASRIGAVNTFWFDDEVLSGHNTDVAGSLATIRALCPDGLHGKSATLIGAGGSAAAVLVALEMSGCQDIRLWTRTADRARDTAERVGVSVQVSDSASAAVDGAAIVINASPLGMHDEAMPVDPHVLSDSAAAFDLVYREGETAWVRACRARGLRAEDGLRMLVEQGAESFRVWFDTEPSLAAMWSALEQRPWMQTQ